MLRVRVLGELELEGSAPPASRPRPCTARVPRAQSRAAATRRARGALLAGRARRERAHEPARRAGRRAAGRSASTSSPARETAGLEDVWTDAAAFASLVTAGRDEDALTLCRGDLLAGLDEDWIVALRDDHREAQSALLARLAEAAPDAETALAHLRARVALDPLSEEAHRDLMVRLDRPAALAVYQRLADRLRSELRIAPSAATRELAESLRVTAPERPPLPRALDPKRSRSPFVGRGGQLERLRAGLAGGEHRLLAISGDPGIGKTRLLAELAARGLRRWRDRALRALAGGGGGALPAVRRGARPARVRRPRPGATARRRAGGRGGGGRAPAPVRGGRRRAGRRARPARAARARRPPLGRPAVAAAAHPRAPPCAARPARRGLHVPRERARPQPPARPRARRPAARPARRARRPQRARHQRRRRVDHRLGRRARERRAGRRGAGRDRRQPVLHRGGPAATCSSRARWRSTMRAGT